MNTVEIIKDVIEKSDVFKTIRLNKKTNKIEICINEEWDEFLNIYYNDLLNLCKEKWSDNKFKIGDIKDVVTIWSREHQYTPEETSENDTDGKNNNKPEWYQYLEVNDKGKIIHSANNIYNLLKYHPQWKDKWSYNDFTQYENYNGQMIDDRIVSVWNVDVEKCLTYTSKNYIIDSFIKLCLEKSFNPFKDALNNIVWDGVERAETFFIDFLGVEDTKLNRSMTKKWLYAMIKRLYEPGCDFDNMLVIYDENQGTGKSKLMKRLVQCLGVPYGYDTSISCGLDKDNIDKLTKTWVAAIDELTSFMKSAPEKTKQFISISEDTARLSYARRSRTFKRHCVFYGTTNIDYFLKDYTNVYERRYWVMDAHGERREKEWWDKNCPDSYLQQVLAEMYYFYRSNPNYNYSMLTVEEDNLLIEVQAKHKTLNNDDVLIEKIRTLLDKKYDITIFDSYEIFKSKATTDYVPVGEETQKFFDITLNDKTYIIDKLPVIWLKTFIAENFKRDLTTNYLSQIMLRLGWKYNKLRYNGNSINCYERI